MIVSVQTGKLAVSPQAARQNMPLYAAAGIGALDYGFSGILSDTWHAKRSEVFDLPVKERTAYFAGIKEAIDANGLTVGQTHAVYPSQFVGGDPDYNAYLKRVTEQCIELTGLWGCPYIVIHPVFGSYDADTPAEEEHQMNLDYYASLIPTLKKAGVVALLENMWNDHRGKIYGACCADFYEVNRYIKELNDLAGEERFGFCFDSGHAVIVGADITRSINLLGDNIKAVHLHDVDGIHDNHTTPFVGVTDWKRVMTALHDIGYAGTLNFEASTAWTMYPDAVRPQAIALLGAIGRYFADTYFSDRASTL